MATIRGLTLPEFQQITDAVSRARYGGNVVVDNRAHSVSGNSFRARIRVANSREAGARHTQRGRRGVGACWHVIRDVYAEVFRQYPHARIVTGLARYNGRNGFLDNYPETARVNIGSPWQPTYMPELCDCPAWIREADVNLTRTAQDPPAPKTRARRTGPASVRLTAPRSVPVVERTEPVGTNFGPSIVDDIDALLAEVAADGWTNPYTDHNSPAKRLS